MTKDENNSDSEEAEKKEETDNEVSKKHKTRSRSRDSQNESVSEDENENKVTENHKPKHKHNKSQKDDEKEEEEEEAVIESESGDDTVDKKRRKKSDGADSIEIEILDEADSKRAKRQANTYAAKKTVAQGMMDIALITANANQLRYLIEFNRHSSTFYVNVILIVLSLILQVGVGVSLIFKGRMDLRGQSKHRHAKKINNYVVVGVFLVTLINVFVASFTVTGPGAGGGTAPIISNGNTANGIQS